MVPTSDHREFTRINRQLDVDLATAGVTAEGTSRDLSLNGLLVEVPGPFSAVAGDVVDVTIHVDGRGGVVAAAARGSIVRRDGPRIAVRLDELIEVESYDVLRTLILYNAEDPAKAEREFGSHLGLRAIPPVR